MKPKEQRIAIAEACGLTIVSDGIIQADAHQRSRQLREASIKSKLTEQHTTWNADHS